MNLNSLAVEICKREGKKKETNIAQVKEILKVLIQILSEDFSLDRIDKLHYLKMDGFYGMIDKLAHEEFAKRLKKTVIKKPEKGKKK